MGGVIACPLVLTLLIHYVLFWKIEMRLANQPPCAGKQPHERDNSGDLGSITSGMTRMTTAAKVSEERKDRFIFT
jgi:hypothetical protein